MHKETRSTAAATPVRPLTPCELVVDETLACLTAPPSERTL